MFHAFKIFIWTTGAQSIVHHITAVVKVLSNSNHCCMQTTQAFHY